MELLAEFVWKNKAKEGDSPVSENNFILFIVILKYGEKQPVEGGEIDLKPYAYKEWESARTSLRSVRIFNFQFSIFIEFSISKFSILKFGHWDLIENWSLIIENSTARA